LRIKIRQGHRVKVKITRTKKPVCILFAGGLPSFERRFFNICFGHSESSVASRMAQLQNVLELLSLDATVRVSAADCAEFSNKTKRSTSGCWTTWVVQQAMCSDGQMKALAVYAPKSQ